MLCMSSKSLIRLWYDSFLQFVNYEHKVECCLCQVQLELTRSFVENQDGTFDPYVPKKVDSPGVGKADSGLPTLKPLELRTFLQIGEY